MSKDTKKSPKKSPTTLNTKRRTRIGPWRNKEEFDLVYKWIFGHNATRETKSQAYRRLIVWKQRQLTLTPSTILSTLIILEAQLKDDPTIPNTEVQIDIRAIYSSAFTRFLNYISSILHATQTKTMYATARDLNLDSFLVDLRHLCAHGHVMPNVEVFRRTAVYCMKWLKAFYWDEQKNSMSNVDTTKLQQKDVSQFSKRLRQVFMVYDAANEALYKCCRNVSDTKKLLKAERFAALQQFASVNEVNELSAVIELVMKNISYLIKHATTIKNLAEIFSDVLIQTKFFIESGKYQKIEQVRHIVKRYEQLFRLMALYGFIESLFHKLVDIAESDFETEEQKKGASFWAKQILVGFIAFKKLKMVYKKQVDKNVQEKLSITTLTEKFVANNVRKMYKEMDLDVRGTLIFGDSLKCPWTLTFNRDYVIERVEKINQYTADVIKNCLYLVDPPMADKDVEALVHLIELFGGSEQNIETDSFEDNKVFTLQQDVFKNAKEDVVMDEEFNENGKKYGIWSMVIDEEDWSKLPLGQLKEY